MEKNFQIEKGIFSVNYKDLLQISADCAVILEAAGAADGGGEVIERKAVDYMLDKYGLLDLSEIRHVSNTVEAEGFLSSTMEEERAKNRVGNQAEGYGEEEAWEDWDAWSGGDGSGRSGGSKLLIYENGEKKQIAERAVWMVVPEERNREETVIAKNASWRYE